MSPFRFEPLALNERGELEAMVLALYQEDSGGEPLSVNKVRRTMTTLAERPDTPRYCVEGRE
jgi:hypothetical protein